MKNKFIQIISMVLGLITVITFLALGVCQIVDLVTFQVGVPKISNVSSFEFLLIGIILFSTFVAMYLLRTEAIVSRDAEVPSQAFLAKKKKAKVALLITFVSVFFTL